MIGKTNSQTGSSLKGEILNISLKTNQAEHSDLLGALITVGHPGGVTQYAWEGKEITVTVPPYVEYIVTYPEVEDYRTPEAFTSTAVAGNSRSLTGTYNTELVSVTLSADDGSDMNGQTVTINGKVHTFDGTNPVTQKVAYGVAYTVSASDKDCFASPEVQTFTAAQSARNLALTYVASALKVVISSNQGASDTAISGVKATVAYGSTSLQVGNGETIGIPTDQTVTVTYPAVTGYATPSVVTINNTNGSTATASGEYKCSVVTVTLADNQTSYNDIASATASVTGGATATLSSGGSVKVPWGSTITITGSAVSGYNTPSASYTAADITKAITLTWATEILTVTVGTDGATPSGYTITVKKKDGTTIGSQTSASKTYKIPYGTEYYVTASSISNFTAPANSSTYTAAGGSNASRSVTMTYKEIKNETLTVAVSGISSGFTVTVVNSSTGATIGSQTTASKTYSITAGTKYYVKANAVSGYVTPANSATRTAVAGASHSVMMTYVAHEGTTSPSNGVWIQDTDGFFHTSDAWTGTYTPNGIAVITSNCRFVMALNDLDTDYTHSENMYYDPIGQTVDGVYVDQIDDLDAAKLDFNGRINTIAHYQAMYAGEEGYAAYECLNYKFANGQSGYIGSVGEWSAVKDNITAIKSALNKCGGKYFETIAYWTSTPTLYEEEYSGAWNVDIPGDFYQAPYYSNFCIIRPFTEIN